MKIGKPSPLWNFLGGWVIWIMLFAFSQTNVFAEMQAEASISSQEVGTGEPFTLTVNVTTDEKPDDFPWPKVDGLEAFTVQKAKNVSHSSNTTIVNGQVSHQTYNIVSFTFTLNAPKAGTYTIGPIRYAHKNYDRNLGQTQVVVTQSQPGLAISPSVSKHKAFVGEQVVYTLRIVPQAGVQSINLPPDMQKLIAEKFFFQRLENKVEPHMVTVNGQPTKVFDLHIALFPLLSGPAKLEGIPVEYQQVARATRRRGGGGMFDMFEDDFFGGNRLTTQRMTSSTVEVEAIALPSPAPQGFSGSVGEYSVSAVVDRNELPSGDAVTLTITVKGNGQPKSIDKPILPDLSAFEVFNPEEENNTQIQNGQLWSSKTFKYVMVPKKKGEYKIAEIAYPYFNPAKGAYLNAKSEPISLTVSQGKELEAAEARVMSQQEIADLGSDIRHLKGVGETLQAEDAFLYKRFGFWLLFALSPISFAAALGVKTRRERLATDSALKRKTEASSHLKKRLRETAGALDKKEPRAFWRALAAALQGFASDQLNIEFRGLTLEDAKVKLSEAGLSPDGVKAYEKLLQEADFGQFAPSGADTAVLRQALADAEKLLRRMEKEI